MSQRSVSIACIHMVSVVRKAAVADLKMSGISNAADGLVQAIADNFDAAHCLKMVGVHTLSTPSLPQRVSKKTTQELEASPMIPQRFLMMLISTGTRDRNSHKCLNPML